MTNDKLQLLKRRIPFGEHTFHRFATELGQKSLQTLTGITNDHTPYDNFQLTRCRADNQNSSCPIKTTTMKNRTPLQTKVMMRID